MSRNKIQANTAIFGRLIDTIPRPDGVVDPLRGRPRWIATDPLNHDWLEYAKLENSLRFTTFIQASIWSFDRNLPSPRSFFVLSGVPSATAPPPTLQQLPSGEPNDSLITAFLAEEAIPLKKDISREDILEHILGISRDDAGYSGHLSEIACRFFEPFAVYEIPAVIANRDVSWLSCQIFLKHSQISDLPFEAEVANACEELVNLSSPQINYEAVACMLLSATWRHALLDAYRCVEYFIPMEKINALRAAVPYGGNASDLWKMVGENLNWRPKDLEELIGLAAQTDLSDRTLVDRELGSAGQLIEPGALAKNIYKTRNAIVHHRSSDTLVINDKKGNAYLRFLLRWASKLAAKYPD